MRELTPLHSCRMQEGGVSSSAKGLWRTHLKVQLRSHPTYKYAVRIIRNVFTEWIPDILKVRADREMVVQVYPVICLKVALGFCPDCRIRRFSGLLVISGRKYLPNRKG